MTPFAEGEAVLGSADGALPEFARATPAVLVSAPSRASYEEAAALPVAGLVALHGLRDAAKVRAGDRLLVNGAAGDIGALAVQLAKVFGAEVTGVCSTRDGEPGPDGRALARVLKARGHGAIGGRRVRGKVVVTVSARRPQPQRAARISIREPGRGDAETHLGSS